MSAFFMQNGSYDIPLEREFYADSNGYKNYNPGHYVKYLEFQRLLHLPIKPLLSEEISSSCHLLWADQFLIPVDLLRVC